MGSVRCRTRKRKLRDFLPALKTESAFEARDTATGRVDAARRGTPPGAAIRYVCMNDIAGPEHQATCKRTLTLSHGQMNLVDERFIMSLR